MFQVENLSMIYDCLSWKLPYFFVLSGFVLTLSYRRNIERGEKPYRNFIINRIFRIYPLFMLTTIVVFITKIAFGAGADIEGASRFLNISWRIAPKVIDLIHSLTLVGLGDTWAYNGPAWTLVFEMRYAIIFPLFFYLIRKSWLFITIFLAMAFVAYNVDSQIARVDIFYATNYQLSNLCSMICFLVFYIGGVLLAFNRERLSAAYNSLPKGGSYAAVALAILFMLAPKWVPQIVPADIRSFANNLVIMVGVMMWVIILINNKFVSNIFTNKVLTALGRSSFSIYMWHTPIITLNYMLLKDYVSVWGIIAISVVATLIVARLSFLYIEQPCIALSHRITRK